MRLAERYFRFALSANFRYADAYNNLGIVLARQGKLREAVASHIEGLKIQPDRASDHNNLGQAYEQLGEMDNAEKEYQAALYFDPNFYGSLFSLGKLYAISKEKKNLDKAIECFTRMTKVDPGALEGFQFLGMALSEKGDKNGAAEALHSMAAILVQKGDLPDAARVLEQVVLLNPQYPQGKEQLDAVRAELAKRGGK